MKLIINRKPEDDLDVAIVAFAEYIVKLIGDKTKVWDQRYSFWRNVSEIELYLYSTISLGVFRARISINGLYNLFWISPKGIAYHEVGSPEDSIGTFNLLRWELEKLPELINANFKYQ